MHGLETQMQLFLSIPGSARPSDCDKHNALSDKLLLFCYCHSHTLTLAQGVVNSQQFVEWLNCMSRNQCIQVCQYYKKKCITVGLYLRLNALAQWMGWGCNARFNFQIKEWMYTWHYFWQFKKNKKFYFFSATRGSLHKYKVKTKFSSPLDLLNVFHPNNSKSVIF